MNPHNTQWTDILMGKNLPVYIQSIHTHWSQRLDGWPSCNDSPRIIQLIEVYGIVRSSDEHTAIDFTVLGAIVTYKITITLTH